MAIYYCETNSVQYNNRMAEAVIDKAEKYDRQIRLWGPQGQQRIEDASVVLLNATPAGTETLKNLILPGRNSIILYSP